MNKIDRNSQLANASTNENLSSKERLPNLDLFDEDEDALLSVTVPEVFILFLI